METKSIIGEWKKYRRIVLDKKMPDLEVFFMYSAFLAGASATMGALAESKDPEEFIGFAEELKLCIKNMANGVTTEEDLL